MIPKVFCEGDLVDGFVAGSGRWGVDIVGFDHQQIRIDSWRVRASFYLGEPVRVRLHKPRRNGLWSGSNIESTLPAFTHSDDRPLALLDEANISGFLESPNIPRWTFGATKAWALALALDLAGWHPVFAPDPLNRQSYLRHPPSARALYFSSRNPRWLRLAARDWGSASGKNRADRTALTLLRQEFESGRPAILITNDQFCDSDDDNLTSEFPELLDDDFCSRIYHPVLREDVISIPQLDLSARIPVGLFQAVPR
jgi:hypothetical protein